MVAIDGDPDRDDDDTFYPTFMIGCLVDPLCHMLPIFKRIHA
jgi:hypothetical protein